jgi:RhtB (resistance to homoserine/threonine) family protein
MESFYLYVMMSIVLILTPGADTMLVTKNTLSHGRWGGGSTALGTATGIMVHSLAAALGLSAILAKSAFLFDIVKYVGAAYLIYLGVSSFQSLRKKASSLEGSPLNSAQRTGFTQGLVTNVLNPKVAIFFLTFLPQFVDPNQDAFIQMLGMGLTYAILLLIWLFLYVYLLEHVRAWMQRPITQQVFQASTGVMLLLFGIKLAFSHR